jgi:tRNA nucleotidyltransferase (CCA-adding enzyme)
MRTPGPVEMMDRIAALPAAAHLIARLRDRTGVYLVGGAVRDLLRECEPLDLDIVVEGDAIQLARELGGEIRAYGRFATGTVRWQGYTYDLATARREVYTRPGALPDVEPAGIEADLSRRDFTVNALAVALTGRAAGCLLAVPQALEDLEARQLRVLHPASFIDDPTRLLRLVRYATRLGFGVEADTEGLARVAIDAGALGAVSGPRIGAELRLLAGEDDPVAGLVALARWGLSRAIHPELGLDEPELARSALALLPADGRADRLALAVAARAIPGGELGALLDRLGFTGADRDVIVAAGTRAEALAGALARASRASDIAGAIGDAPDEAVALAGALGPRAAASRWFAELRGVRLSITGDDLITAGVPRGPEVGHGLAAALAARLDGNATDRAAELEVALAAAQPRR